jgi:hypothetical protein
MLGGGIMTAMIEAPKRGWLRFSIRGLMVAATVLACWLGWSLIFGYNPSAFKGQGSMTDTGFWSYPRYHILMPAFSLEKTNEHTFTLEGLPPERMSISFRLSGRIAACPESMGTLEDNIKQSSVTFKCKLSDDNGVTVCEIADPLHNWIISVRPSEMYLWHMRSRDLKISSKRRYSLTVGIEFPEPDMTVEPQLTGGGNELP